MTAQIRWTHCCNCFTRLPLMKVQNGDSECDRCQEIAKTAGKHRGLAPTADGNEPLFAGSNAADG